MKNYFDSFYEIIHKNSVKRRRMVSLLLVLSIFVSSGVLWELRDTVITMVNEPLCGIEEHEHTDECYEKVLVCGLEENEEHTHTEECYKNVLVCGHENHFHTLQCYTDEELPDNDEQSEDDENIISIGLPDDDAVLPVFNLANDSVRVMDDEEPEPVDLHGDVLEPVPRTDTIDNIARGIKFTLFDYHDPNNELEARQNNYGISWDSEHNQWVHNNIKYVGVNYDYVNNHARNIYDDILFFSYGTPAFTGEEGTFNATGNDAYKNYQRDWDNVNNRYNPSKNNYAGDYNADANGDTLSGNRPVQGIVVNELVDGYPKINNVVSEIVNNEVSEINYGSSLAYLFNETSSDYKSVYTDVNYLLKSVVDSETGSEHLVYNSDEDYAFFDTVSKNFTIYDGTYHIINDNHHFMNDPIPGSQTNEKYPSDVGYEMKIGFFPFDEYNPQRRDPNFDGNNDFNHHFGLKMEAEFNNTGNDDNPVVFRYSGDDDMWIFVDGKLLLDIGGIHEPAEGLIDFTRGYVWVQDDLYGQSYSDIMNTAGMNPNLRNSEVPRNFKSDNNHKWIVKPIGELIGSDWDDNESEGHKHEIKMFYLERGGCYSNLAIDMNLPTVKPLSVTKTVDFQGHYSDDYDKKDTGGQEYSFTIKEVNDQGELVNATLGNGVSNTFTLKDGERRDFYGLDSSKNYVVIENNVDTDIYSGVKVNDNEVTIGADGASSGNAVPLSSVDTYNFTNTVRQEMTDISVSKSWQEVAGAGDVTHGPIYFKIYQTDSLDSGEPKQVEINGVSTFALTSENSWAWTPKDSNNNPIQLPSRYGEHIYTYSVKELNVPDGYEATYTKSGNNITIKNTAQTNELWVEKQWIDATEADKKPVQLTLKRKMMASSSDATSLTIKLLDPGGNELSSVTTSDVYVGGSVEFSLGVPGDVQYWWWDGNYKVGDQQRYYKLSSEELGFKQLGDKRFEVSNLKKNTAEYHNEVDIKIITDNTDDSLLLLHHSFTRNTDGWEANGDTPPEGYNYDNAKNNNQPTYAEILTSGGSAYAKGDGLLVRGRTADWNGVRLKLDPLKFKANHTYTFSVYVKYDNETSFPATTEFVMTFNDGRESSTSYKRLLTQSVSKGSDWVQLVGTVTLPDDINPYGMFLLIETNDSDGNENTFNGPEKFRMDEFTAIEGYKDVSVASDTGVVTISPYTWYNSDFSKGLENWDKFGSSNLILENTDQYSDRYYLRVSSRTETYQGAMLNLSELVPGNTYKVHAVVSGNAEDGDRDFKITFNDGNGNNTTVKQAETVNNYVWAFIDTNFMIPTTATKNDMYMYIESGDSYDYRIYEFTISDLSFSDIKDGYDLTNGVYVSNNNQYQIAVDTTSITSPRFYSSNYDNDDEFGEMVISLDNSNNWKYYFTKTSLTGNKEEKAGFRYIYYVASETVNGATLDSDYVMLPIENNNVASNDSSTPILVKNKNIKFTLPETGGGGTGRIYFFGGVLTAIGIISLSALYRRKRRRV